MKCLERNKRDFEYLPATGEETDLNEYGEHTGEFHPEFGEPVPMRGNISVPSGYATQQFYGMDIRYTHVLVMDDPDADIKENGKIRWKGDEYQVRAVHPSLNSLSVALRKMSGDDEV